jgi:hypothetical protein
MFQRNTTCGLTAMSHLNALLTALAHKGSRTVATLFRKGRQLERFPDIFIEKITATE